MNETPNENEFTAEDGEIRFDPEKDRELQLLQFETCLATLRLG